MTDLKADLDGMIYAYNCSMRLAHVTSATRIVSSKSETYNIFTAVAHNMKQVVGFETCKSHDMQS